MRKTAILCLALAFGLVCWTASPGDTGEKEKKDAKKDDKEGSKGITIGILVGKEKNYIEVKADGDEAPRKYVPQWKGGTDKGGGLDKDVLKVFEGLKVGSRIEVQWVYEERLRALAVKVLVPPKEKDKEK